MLTKEEVDEGWLEGPFSVDELTKKLSPCWMTSVRFGINQNGKVRAIDDYSRYGQNSSTSTHERLDPGGIDTVVGVIKSRLLAVTAGGNSVSVRLTSGKLN